jgi:hypothetical protein
VALELGCTPGGSICCLVFFFCSSARPAGAKKASRPGSTHTSFFIVSLEHGSAGLEASGWGRFCTTGQSRRCKPNTKMRTSRAHRPVLETRKGGLFSPGFGRPQSGRAGHMQVSKHALRACREPMRMAVWHTKGCPGRLGSSWNATRAINNLPAARGRGCLGTRRCRADPSATLPAGAPNTKPWADAALHRLLPPCALPSHFLPASQATPRACTSWPSAARATGGGVRRCQEHGS